VKTFTLFSTTEYFFGRGLFPSLCLCLEGPKVVIVDEALVEKYGRDLALQLGCRMISVPQGESAKLRRVKEEVEDTLLQHLYGSDTTLIALGGGAISDLVGFVAATYHRGISWISIPTTVVGIVDASIGGKTGVNTPAGKNMIGAFHSPKKVIADVGFLDTLPEKEKICGLAEVYKMGLISDAWPHSDQMEELLWNAAVAKKKIVEQDPPPREKGLRRVLNFGHTIGHALEKVSNHALSHGEAVVLGSLAESYLSFKLGHLSQEAFRDIQSLYRKLSYPFRLPREYTREKMFLAMQGDKKNARGHIRMVLLGGIGLPLPFDGEYCTAVSPSEIDVALQWLEKAYG
jgi:3-dehydroquinate synthase